MSSVSFLLLVLAATILSMLVYVASGRRRDADATSKGSQFLLGLGDFFVHWIMWILAPAERLALALGLGPGFFNFAGLACGLLGGFFIARGELEWGGWLIAAGGVADVLDGRIARARKLTSAYGKFIDSTLDRFVEVFLFLGLVIYLRHHPLGPFLAAAAITGSLLVSYAQARGETVGVSRSGGLMQRAERLVLTCLACLFDGPVTDRVGRAPGSLVLWAMGVIALGTFATAIYRTIWISRRLRERT